MASIRYTHAIVCRIPLSLRTRGEIDLEEAKRQHESYVRLLRELSIDVIELPPDESLPHCAFVEDAAVICNGIALIARPGAPHRAKEVESIRAVLKKELGLPLFEIADQNAKLDGGDVLFTGKEFFVGLSAWTNEAGARAVAAAFPEFPCTPVKVQDLPNDSICVSTLQGVIQVSENKHLKSYITLAGPDLLCVGAGKESREVLKRIEREATFSYQTLTVPEDEAANVLFVNGTLVHRAIEEIPDSFQVFCDRLDSTRRSLCMSELAKGSSGLTSCCLLVRKTRPGRPL